jgi:hypothetical protein
MALHLMKLAVGVESVDQMATWQRRRLVEMRTTQKDANLFHVTRNRPKRAEELAAGGSIYWVIKRRILVRQRLLDFEATVNREGRKACRMMLDPKLERTVPRRQRPFQGWRYLAGTDAPPDLTVTGGLYEDLPVELAEELRDLGIL